MSKALPLLIALLCSAVNTPAYALTAFERMVLQELSCERSPRPTRTLVELVRLGKIDPTENIGYDSLSCWKIIGSLSIAGMSFSSVCAFEEDSEVRSRNPDLLYRGPGTSPGQTLSFGSDQSAEILSNWYLQIFGAGLINSAIAEGEMTILGDPSEVSCTSWMQ